MHAHALCMHMHTVEMCTYSHTQKCRFRVIAILFVFLSLITCIGFVKSSFHMFRSRVSRIICFTCFDC